MAATSIGPIGARQINNNLYVGRSDLTTIQSAVTFAVRLAPASYVVVIPFEYVGTDLISAVTGGADQVEIIDQRSGQQQSYYWNVTSGQYLPRRMQQASGFVSLGQPSVIPTGSAAFYFVPSGTAGAGTAHIDVTANPGMGMPALNINGVPSDGTPFVTFMRLQTSTAAPGITLGVPEVEMPSQLALFNGNFDSFNLWVGDFYLPGNKGMTVWARADEDAIDFQGQTIGGAYDQTIRLNFLGGDVEIGPITFDASGNIIGAAAIAMTGDLTGVVNITASGDLDVDSITANDADFAACAVNNSPVRTFANTPDGPGEGMVWPPDGIPVSLGDHWQNPSIDPDSLVTWPTAGIPVSTGSEWGTPINPADVARLSLANVFTGSTQTMQDILSNSIETDGTSNQPARTGARLDFLTDHARHISISSGTTAPGGLRFIGLKNDGTAYTEYMTLDGTGAYLTTPAGTGFNITAPAGVNVNGNILSTQTGVGPLYGSIASAPNLASGQRITSLIGVSNTTAQTLGLGFYNGGSAPANYGFFNLGGTAGETRFDQAGNWTMPGMLASLGVNLSSAGVVSGLVRITTNGGAAYIDLFGPNTTTPGSAVFRTTTSDGGSILNSLILSSNGATVNGNLVANSSTAYLANAATPSAARVVAGFATLVNGTATVTFAKPFAAGQVYVFLSVIGAGAVGATTTPQVWVFGASNTAITINASSATANNTVFYTVYGNP
jgi:hypothetical protein